MKYCCRKMSNSERQAESSENDVLKCVTCASTLHDPVLLSCLHSICSSCTSEAAGNVICPVCQVPTDTSIGKANTLVASLEHRSVVLKSVFSCKHCIDEDKEDATAVAWCYMCQLPLCTDLQKCHKILHPAHNVTPLNECTLLSELYRPPVRHCTKHGEDLKLVCFTCQDCCCYKCAHTLCYKSCHDVQPLDDPDAVKRISDRIADLARMHTDLNSTTIPLQSYLQLPEAVASSRQESLNMLQNAKKKVIESINRAYAAAESSLLTCWDTIISKSLCLRESVERLQARLAWSSKYCQLVLDSNDTQEVFPQLEAVISSMCTLLEEARQIKEPVDPLKMVSLNICLPSDLDVITSDWLGLAKVNSEDFSSSVNDMSASGSNDYYVRKVSTLMELEQHLHDWKEDQKRHQRVLQSLEQLQSEMKSKDQQLTALTKPLTFHSNTCGTFKGAGQCWDVAVTPQGSLLVAAMADGLKEYDATTFREMATWKPDSDLLGQEKTVWVRTVDVLSDGRAVVGLDPKLVVLLRRDDVSDSESGSESDSGSNSDSRSSVSGAAVWRVERRFAELQAPPRRLSTWDDRLLAVLEDRWDVSRNTWLPGSGLVLLSLRCNGDDDEDKRLRLHSRQLLKYNASSVALTDRGVMVASSAPVEINDSVGSTGGGRKCYVVDCYSHQGVRLWRHEVSGDLKVMCVCSDSVGRVLYAAKQGSVVALSMDGGRELSAAIVLSAKETKSPYAVALDRATQRLLALISFDGDQPNIVTVFTAA